MPVIMVEITKNDEKQRKTQREKEWYERKREAICRNDQEPYGS